MKWAAKYGITEGTWEGYFSPNAYIDRQQMATFFVRYFETFGVKYETGANITTTPSDIDSTASWARDAVLKLWRTGLLVGSYGNFMPARSATRAEAAMICRRADEAVDTWYSEPGVPSARMKIDPATGLPYAKDNTKNNDKNNSNNDSDDDSDDDDDTTSSDSYSVSFYDGSRPIKSFAVKKGEALGQLPTVAESSKANYILEGYYTDSNFTTPFYAEDPVTSNLRVYARYESMGDPEALTVDSFARMDQQPNVSFRFKALEGTADTLEAAKAAVSLAVKDGSDPVEITVSSSGGVYTVSAPAGFNPGCSYELDLADGWAFLPDGSGTIDSEAIRTAAFSIEMAEVENLSMNEGIQYIQDTDQINYTYVDSSRQTWVVPELASDADITNGGSFDYDNAGNLRVNDILCIYVGARPDDGDDSTKTEEAIYAKVSGVSGSTVNFVPLTTDDQMRLYEIPDNFPIQVAALPAGDAGTVSFNALDAALYAQMVGATEGTADKAEEKLGVGDFVSLYVNSDAIASENDVYFGRITEISGDTITYVKSSAEEIEESANLYKSADVENTDYVTEEEAAQIETIVQTQVEQSSFAEEAAYLLADMAVQTEGFQNSVGLMSISAADESGAALSEAQLAAYADAMVLSDDDDDGKPDVETKVSVVLDKDKLHFGNKGVQLAVEVTAQFEADAQDEGKIHFDLSATFVQEVAVDPRVKGKLVYKKILKVIPVPTGVQVNAIVDVKSYTAMALKADIYTEGPEEQSTWEKFKAFTKDPSELANIPGLPDSLTDGLKTVGDAIDKIEETKDKIDKGLEDTDKLKSDLEALWSVVEASAANGLTRETYENACETLGKTSVAGELMEMLHLSEDEISADYYHGLDELMDKYSEMLERETDWVQLVDAEMFDSHTPPEYGVMVGVQGKFIVRADVNITLGTNLEYEVGKRYNFWFRVGLFKPTSGSSTMDLIDEHFAFQFYVMGKLGLKTGVRLKIYAAIGSKDAVSVGITTELGPYVKLYGFFIYDYSKYRPANTANWISKEQMAGALYLEFGLYLMVGMEAKALFLEFDKDFVDEEFSLLEAGDKFYYYGPAYMPEPDDKVRVDNSSPMDGYFAAMTLPDIYRSLRTIDLTTGAKSREALDYDQYNFQLSNPNFELVPAPDNKSAVICVKSVPEGVRYMACDLTITYKYGKMAFSTYDMSTTVHLVWTDMDASELKEYYTVSVRVPDAFGGGYSTVWSQRVQKNVPFDLPTSDEIRSLLSWSDAKYVETTGYGGQQTEDLTVIRDTTYEYQIGYQTYSVTVNGIEGGSGASRIFTGRYGEPFDFSALTNTGTDGPGEYTRFTGLMMNGQTLALNQPIDGRFTTAKNAAATAQYADETVTATFQFTGFDHGDMEITLRKGDVPNTMAVENEVPSYMTITGFYPAVGPIEGDTTYQVVCEVPAGSMATITFDAKGGSAVESKSLPIGSVLGSLPTPIRTGYTFGGWFTDDGTFQIPVDANTQIAGSMTLYAKWTADTMTVSFDVNGGDSLTETSREVTFDQPYGELPAPTRTDWRFDGWFTQLVDGELITAETLVSTAETHTLYAHWTEMREIPRDVFGFSSTTPLNIGYFSGGWRWESTIALMADDIKDRIPYEAANEYGGPVFNPEEGAEYTFGDFKITYKLQEDALRYADSSFKKEIKGAGIYTVKITREAEGLYKKFEQTYTGAIEVSRVTAEMAENDISDIPATILKKDRHNDMSLVTGTGVTYGRAIPDSSTSAYNGWKITKGSGTAYYMDLSYRTLSKSVKYTFKVVRHGTNTTVGSPVTLESDGFGNIQRYVVFKNLPAYDQDVTYDILVTVQGHANYEDHTITIDENTDLY